MTRHRIMMVLLAALLAGCGKKEEPSASPPTAAEEKKAPEPKVETGEEIAVIETDEGNIVLRFFEADAPKTVAEFKRLAGRNFYNGTTFHRVMPGKLIQGGDPLSRDRDPYNDGTGNSGNLVPAEFNKRPFKPGTVGLARSAASTSGSCQFFICLSRFPEWDGDYTAFAEVVEGLEVVRKISQARTNPKAHPRLKERPIREQPIKAIRIERRELPPG